MCKLRHITNKVNKAKGFMFSLCVISGLDPEGLKTWGGGGALTAEGMYRAAQAARLRRARGRV